MSYYDDASLIFLAGAGAQKDGKAYSVKPVPEYNSELVTNGDFASNINDWAAKDSTIIWDNGKLKCNNSSGNGAGGPRQNVGLQNNKTYIFTATIQLISATANGTFAIFTSSAVGNGQSDVYYGSTLVAGGDAITETGQFTTGTDGDVSIQFWVDRANAVYTIDNVSVYEVGQDWTFGTGWSVGDDKAVKSVSATDTNLSQSSVFTVGKTYKIVFNIESISGNIWVSGISDFIQHTTTGVKTIISKATNSNITFRSGSGSNVTITNISVKEVGQNWNLNGVDFSLGSVFFNNTTDYLFQNSGYFTSGAKYKLTFDGSGNLAYRTGFAGADGTRKEITLPHTAYITATADTNRVQPYGAVGNLEGTLTNVSVIEITDDTNLPRINYEGFSYQNVLGSELVTNGDFATNTWWTVGQFWSIANGFVTRAVVGSELNYSVSRSNLLTIGKSYKVEIDVNSVDSGSVKVVLGSTNGTEYTSAGVYIFEGVCTSSTNFKISPSSDFNGSIDNVSIKEVLVNGDFTFSRGSNLAATRVDAGPNYYIEKGRENLLLYSQEFDNSYYGKSLGTLTANQTTAPDGSLTADLFTKTSAVNSVSELKKSSPIYASIGVHTYSVYVKQNVGDNVLLRLDSSGNTASALFTFSTKSINPTGSNVIDATATELSDGWFRLSVTGNVTSTSWSLSIATLYANPTNDSVFVWGAQLEQSLAATEYIETTTTTGTAGILENTPRFNYSFGASCPSLLLEGSRTNLFPNSEYFSSWQVFRGSLTANSISSPEGVVNAYRYEENSDTGQHFVRFQSISMTSGTDYTASVFVKAGELTYIVLGSNSASLWNPSTTTFNLSTGSVTSGGGTIEPIGNDGWYRCIISGECLTTTSSAGLEITTSGGAGSTGDGLYIYGAQIEQGSYPTSYIPTYGTSVTRAFDECIDAGDVNTFNSTEGTIYGEQKSLESNFSYNYFGALSDGTNNNRLEIRQAGTGLQFLWRVGGTFQSVIALSNAPFSSTIKYALRYSSTDIKLYVNGSLVGTVNSPTLYPSGTLNNFQFADGSGGTNFRGTVKQALYFSTALSDADLAALTTI